MIQKAIIHKPTRVIRRLTIDVSPSIAQDEEIVELADHIDLEGGFWKLDAKTMKVRATPTEAENAGVDEEKANQERAAKREELALLINEISILPSNVTLPILVEKVKKYFQKIGELKGHGI